MAPRTVSHDNQKDICLGSSPMLVLSDIRTNETYPFRWFLLWQCLLESLESFLWWEYVATHCQSIFKVAPPLPPNSIQNHPFFFLAAMPFLIRARQCIFMWLIIPSVITMWQTASNIPFQFDLYASWRTKIIFKDKASANSLKTPANVSLIKSQKYSVVTHLAHHLPFLLLQHKCPCRLYWDIVMDWWLMQNQHAVVAQAFRTMMLRLITQYFWVAINIILCFWNSALLEEWINDMMATAVLRQLAYG